MAKLKKSKYKLDTTDGPRTLWEMEEAEKDVAHSHLPFFNFFFSQLSEDSLEVARAIEIKLLGRSYEHINGVVIDPKGIRSTKQVMVNHEPIK